jgi:hypothetical protein
MNQLDIENIEGHTIRDISARSNRFTIQTDKGVFLLMHTDGDNGPARVAAVFQDKGSVIGKTVEKAGRNVNHCCAPDLKRFLWTGFELQFPGGVRLKVCFLAESNTQENLEVHCYGVLNP